MARRNIISSAGVLVLTSLTNELLVGKKFFGENANRSNQGYKIIVRWTERVLLLISLAMHYECSIVKGYIKKGTSEEIPLVFNRIL